MSIHVLQEYSNCIVVSSPSSVHNIIILYARCRFLHVTTRPQKSINLDARYVVDGLDIQVKIKLRSLINTLYTHISTCMAGLY